MAHARRRRAVRTCSHQVASKIGWVVICGLLIFPSLSIPLRAGQETQRTQSVEALQLAAAEGDADAQYGFGLACLDGDGVAQNDGEAVRWFRLAANQGHAAAQHHLGLAYANGTAVPRDAVEAVRWFRLAAGQGYAVSQHNLAIGYANGLGLSQDVTEAARWYRLAADHGYGGAVDDLTALEAIMTSEQIAEARRLAREWTPTNQP